MRFTPRFLGRSSSPLGRPGDVELAPPSYPDHLNSPRFDPYLEGHSSHYPCSQRSQGETLHNKSHFDGASGHLQPWLGLRARLGLSILSPALVSILFVACRLFLSSDDVDTYVRTTKQTILASCQSAEQSASIAASLPMFMADSMNDRTAQAVQDTVQGLLTVLMLALTALEQLLVFLADSYRSLFVCFIQLMVQETLSILISAVQLMSEAVKTAGQGIKAAIAASVTGVNDFISTALDGVNDVLKLVGQSIKTPTIAQPDLSALDNVTLPDSFENALLRLNSSLPTLDDLKQKMDALIMTPFESLKMEVNQTLHSFTFNRTLLPVPQRQTVSFCSQVDVSPFDDLAHDMRRVVYIGVGLLSILALLLILTNMGLEWWSWRSLKRHVERTREAWLSIDGVRDAGLDLLCDSPRCMDPSQQLPTEKGESAAEPHQTDVLSLPRFLSLLQLSTHPLLATLVFKVARPLGVRSQRARTNLRWFLAFIAHPAALVVLSIGLIGLLSVELQMAALKPIQKHYENRIAGSFDSFGDSLLSHINDLSAEASHDYSNRSNALVLQAQTELNDHMFAWVNATTSNMNNTLNELMDGIAEALNTTFADTPLYTPLQSFINCILGQKVTKIEQAITWLQANAHVNLPLVSPDVLMLDPARSQELMAPFRNAAVGNNGGNAGAGGAEQQDPGAVERIVDAYMAKLRKERIMFLLFLGIYAVVVVVGLASVVCSVRRAKCLDVPPTHDAEGFQANEQAGGRTHGVWPDGGSTGQHASHVYSNEQSVPPAFQFRAIPRESQSPPDSRSTSLVRWLPAISVALSYLLGQRRRRVEKEWISRPWSPTVGRENLNDSRPPQHHCNFLLLSPPQSRAQQRLETDTLLPATPLQYSDIGAAHRQAEPAQGSFEEAQVEAESSSVSPSPRQAGFSDSLSRSRRPAASAHATPLRIPAKGPQWRMAPYSTVRSPPHLQRWPLHRLSSVPERRESRNSSCADASVVDSTMGTQDGHERADGMPPRPLPVPPPDAESSPGWYPGAGWQRWTGEVRDVRLWKEGGETGVLV